MCVRDPSTPRVFPGGATMIGHCLLLALLVGAQGSGAEGGRWAPYTSKDGNFVVDFPGKPTKTFTRQSRSRTGQVKIVVAQCDTPDVLYTAEKIELPQAAGLKPADMEAILDYWRDDLANEFNGKVVDPEEAPARHRGRTAATSRSRGGPTPRRAWRRSGSASTSRRRCSTSSSPRPPRTASCRKTSATSSPRSARGRSAPRRSGPIPSPRASRWAIGAWRSTRTATARSTTRARSLEISIPNTHHDLNADNDKLNAPACVREVTGDFSMTVKVDGGFKPSEKSTNPKAVPYIGGGILVWQDSDNYIFLGRAAINRRRKISEFAAFEEREWGTRGALNNRGHRPRRRLPPHRAAEQPHPRLHQQGRQDLGQARPDGAELSRHAQGRPVRDQRLHRAGQRPVRGLQLHRGEGRRQGQDQEPLNRFGRHAREPRRQPAVSEEGLEQAASLPNMGLISSSRKPLTERSTDSVDREGT